MASHFDRRRQQLFHSWAQYHLPRKDPAAHLLPWAPVPAGPDDPPGSFDVRSSVYLVTALVETGRHEQAWPILNACLDQQDTRPHSLTRGNYFWRTHWKHSPGYVRDPNAASFIAPHLYHLLARHGHTVPHDLAEATRRSLRLAGDGLLAHRCTWGYTNIALLNMAAMFQIGSLLDDARLRQLALWDWEEWRNHTARQGAINETFSNCYTAVQIEALGMLLDCPDLPGAVAGEIRMAMHHLIAAAMLDLHPAIGRITGPQSRAYEPDRRLRHHSNMDTLLYLLFGQAYLPSSPRNRPASPWMGSRIRREDLLVDPANLPLPRQTESRTHGYRRLNYLGDTFALGSVQCENRLFGLTTPVQLCYQADHDHCVLPVLAEHRPLGYFASQHEGRLLAAVTWLDGRGLGPREESLIGQYSGLKTGRSDCVNRHPDFTAALKLELGPAGAFELLDQAGEPIACSQGPLNGASAGLRLGVVQVVLDFFGDGDQPPRLSLLTDDTGIWVLRVRAGDTATRPGVQPRMLGLRMQVTPAAADDTPLATRISIAQAQRPRVSRQANGWQISEPNGSVSGGLSLHVDEHEPIFYSSDHVRVTANQWALSLSSPGGVQVSPLVLSVAP